SLNRTRNLSEVYVNTARKSLLLRADFTLDRSRGGDRLIFKRWRRVLADALPRLMGCADRCSRVVLRLREGEEQGRFSLWMRLPIDRFPARERLRKLQEKLRARLESVLLAVGGDIVKFVLRRRWPKPALRLLQPEAPSLQLARPEPECLSV